MSEESQTLLRKVAAGIAHDLNNTLGGISSLVLASLIEVKDGPIADDLRQISRTAKEGLALASRLALIGQSAQPKLSSVDALTLLQTVANKNNAQLRAETTASIHADERLMKEALLALIQNAIEASAPQTPISLWVEITRDVVSFCVSNQSSATLPPLSTMRQPYYSTKKEGRGRGLGLSIAWCIIGAHQGNLSYTQSNGETIFSLSLPGSAKNKTSPTPPDTQAKPSTRPVVLLADDDRFMRLAVERLLHRAGYRVLSASDGNEAWSLFETHQNEIALVFFDRWMPGYNGLELIKKIRQLSPNMPALIISGDHESPDALQHEGVTAYVEKPFEPEAVLQLLRKILGAP